MEIIWPEYQSTATATTEDIEHPASNLMDNRPNKKWRATGASATVTIAVGAGVNNAVGVYGIEADQVIVTVKNASETVTIATETFTINRDRLYMAFTEQTIALHVKLAFSVSSGVCAAGVVKVGDAQSFPNPKWGASREYKDVSILHEMASGGLRVHQRGRGRRMSPTCEMTEAQSQALDDIYWEVGAEAVAMLLLSGDTDWRQEWTGLFHMPDGPKTVFEFNDRHIITLPLREAM